MWLVNWMLWLVNVIGDQFFALRRWGGCSRLTSLPGTGFIFSEAPRATHVLRSGVVCVRFGFDLFFKISDEPGKLKSFVWRWMPTDSRVFAKVRF